MSSIKPISKSNFGDSEIYEFAPNTIELLNIGKRLRETDKKKVRELADSIKSIGLLQPITVNKNNKGIHLLTGLHRYEAIKLVWNEVEEPDEYRLFAIIKYIAADNLKQVEIAENLHRNDLTKEQRKEFGLLYLKGLDSKKANSPNTSVSPNTSNSPNKKQGEQSWFANWYEEVNIPKKTAQTMWNAFKKSTGHTETPAIGEHLKNEFIQWHLDKIEADKQDKEISKQSNLKQQKQQAQAKAIKEFNQAVDVMCVAVERAIKAGVSSPVDKLIGAVEEVEKEGLEQ